MLSSNRTSLSAQDCPRREARNGFVPKTVCSDTVATRFCQDITVIMTRRLKASRISP
jgi:hypothetical protein